MQQKAKIRHHNFYVKNPSMLREKTTRPNPIQTSTINNNGLHLSSLE